MPFVRRSQVDHWPSTPDRDERGSGSNSVCFVNRVTSTERKFTFLDRTTRKPLQMWGVAADGHRRGTIRRLVLQEHERSIVARRWDTESREM